jgi:phenylpyruvate tautomerase PptA (4-oxalocrotonate tautomerase family)
MPMLDAYIPEGALSPKAERDLVARMTDLLLEHEGVDPANKSARHLAWIFVHRPQVYVAGALPQSPRYLFRCQVPEGQYNDERRTGMTAATTQAVADAEDGAWPHPKFRVCVFTFEVPDGTWGGGGRIIRLRDIYELVWPPKPGMDGGPRDTAEQVLAARHQDKAEEVLAAVNERPQARTPT